MSDIELRFVWRDVPVLGKPGIMQHSKILQYRKKSSSEVMGIPLHSEWGEWEDVPLVMGEDGLPD